MSNTQLYIRIPTKPWEPKLYRGWSLSLARAIGPTHRSATRAEAYAKRREAQIKQAQENRASVYARIPEEEFEVVE